MQESTITETDAIKACYTAIHTFFDVFDLPSARKYILTSLLAANNNKLWKGQCPGDLIVFFEEFESLANAVKKIAACGCKRQSAIIQTGDENNTPDYSRFELYCRKTDRLVYRMYFPKYLSAKEFFNPYKALKKAVWFLQADDFNDLFEYIVQYALSYDSFTDASLEWDTLKINIMLQKLTEAAYLLLVRTHTKPGSLINTGGDKEENKNMNADRQ